MFHNPHKCKTVTAYCDVQATLKSVASHRYNLNARWHSTTSMHVLETHPVCNTVYWKKFADPIVVLTLAKVKQCTERREYSSPGVTQTIGVRYFLGINVVGSLRKQC